MMQVFILFLLIKFYICDAGFLYDFFLIKFYICDAGLLYDFFLIKFYICDAGFYMISSYKVLYL